ncbi:MAG: hypothetical protein M0D53_01215 [Flavobacterium sp. JAD_PAG50586_2]|nr:MAG: hypothetical protein M0D53_01215 [Flavobacterium sp. JAD_PAG50586_2]
MSKSIIQLIRSYLGILTDDSDPVQWKIEAIKTSFNTYSICMFAFIEHPYKLYSQESTPLGPLPTIIKFEKNPYINLIGNPKEVGTKIEVYEEAFKAKTQFYSTAVAFVQEVAVIKLNWETVKGEICYIVCSEKNALVQNL